MITKFCLVDSIQLLTQQLKTCSRLYCCFLGKNTFLGLVGSHQNSSLFEGAFKLQSSYFSRQSKSLEKYFHDIVTDGKSDTILTLMKGSIKVEKILKNNMDCIPSPSPSVKIQIVGSKICLRCKSKTLLGF